MPLFGPPNIERMKTKHDVKGLIKALDYKNDSHIRADAAKALGELGYTLAVEPLINALNDTLYDPMPDVREAVIEALGNLKDDRAVYPLSIACEKSSSRLEAYTALEKIRYAQALPFLSTIIFDRKELAGKKKTAIKNICQIYSSNIEWLVKSLEALPTNDLLIVLEQFFLMTETPENWLARRQGRKPSSDEPTTIKVTTQVLDTLCVTKAEAVVEITSNFINKKEEKPGWYDSSWEPVRLYFHKERVEYAKTLRSKAEKH